jgi:hypothetical protein
MLTFIDSSERTSYGRLLILKITLFAAMVCLLPPGVPYRFRCDLFPRQTLPVVFPISASWLSESPVSPRKLAPSAGGHDGPVVSPFKLAGVHGDRWTVRFNISINVRCPARRLAWRVGICPGRRSKDRHQLKRVHIYSAGDRDEFHDVDSLAASAARLRWLARENAAGARAQGGFCRWGRSALRSHRV